MTEIRLEQSFQHTLKDEIYFEGVGLFTGSEVSVRLIPQDADSGIIFKRIDLPDCPIIETNVDFAQKTPGYTLLEKNTVSVQTVEHLLSALSIYQIDNLLIEISGPEVPILDGSAKDFVALIEKVGVQNQSKPKSLIKVEKPIFYSENAIQIVAIPSDCFRISYTLHYPHSKFLASQFYSSEINASLYKTEIAPARTFSIYEEIEPLLKNGGLKGGGLHNALIIKDDKVLNPEGMRFSDEPVRHKVLDLIGDLSLIGNRFLAHVIAIRSGHVANAAFAATVKKLMKECLYVQHV